MNGPNDAGAPNVSAKVAGTVPPMGTATTGVTMIEASSVEAVRNSCPTYSAVIDCIPAPTRPGTVTEAIPPSR